MLPCGGGEVSGPDDLDDLEKLWTAFLACGGRALSISLGTPYDPEAFLLLR